MMSNTIDISSDCIVIDNAVAHGSCLRIGIIILFISYKVISKSKDWSILSLIFSFWNFITHEGIGMVIYFSISFCIDILTIFFISHGNYCKYQFLVATYSMASITFLPNCLFASWKQKKWYDEGDYLWKFIFIITCIILTIIFFFTRLMLIFVCHYIDLIVFILNIFNYDIIIFISTIVPVAVDWLQSFILTYVAKETEDDTDLYYSNYLDA